MRYVVGYVPNQHGADALSLAVTLAQPRSAHLDIVVVLRVESQGVAGRAVPGRLYLAELEEQAREWLGEAMARLPEGVDATGHVRFADSVAEGLIEAATDPALGEEAALIALGAAERGIRGRITIGSVASALLHAAPVPVALAPTEYEPHPAISRVTCATGTRQGAEVLVDVAIGSSARRRVPLRLISLVTLDTQDWDEERHDDTDVAEQHAEGLAERARAVLPPECPVTTAIGRGDTLEECVSSLDFADSELVMVGSSRLAGPRRLFLGPTAMKILRALEVPMIVVPRDYVLPDEGGDEAASDAQ